VWNRSSGLTRIGTSENQVGKDISADGSVVVGFNGAPGFVWRKGVGSEETSWLPDAVSDDGTVIAGMRELKPSGRTILVRQVAGTLVDVGSHRGDETTYLMGMSGSGSTMVGFSYSPSKPGTAFRWTEASGFEDLGIPTGATSAMAHGVSPDGTIVFGAGSNTSGSVNTVWRSGSGWVTVIEFLREFGLDSFATGWSNFGIWRCSADNKTFLGFGTNPSGQFTAWIARI